MFYRLSMCMIWNWFFFSSILYCFEFVYIKCSYMFTLKLNGFTELCVVSCVYMLHVAAFMHLVFRL